MPHCVLLDLQLGGGRPAWLLLQGLWQALQLVLVCNCCWEPGQPGLASQLQSCRRLGTGELTPARRPDIMKVSLLRCQRQELGLCLQCDRQVAILAQLLGRQHRKVGQQGALAGAQRARHGVDDHPGGTPCLSVPSAGWGRLLVTCTRQLVCAPALGEACSGAAAAGQLSGQGWVAGSLQQGASPSKAHRQPSWPVALLTGTLISVCALKPVGCTNALAACPCFLQAGAAVSCRWQAPAAGSTHGVAARPDGCAGAGLTGPAAQTPRPASWAPGRWPAAQSRPCSSLCGPPWQSTPSGPGSRRERRKCLHTPRASAAEGWARGVGLCGAASSSLAACLPAASLSLAAHQPEHRRRPTHLPQARAARCTPACRWRPGGRQGRAGC